MSHTQKHTKSNNNSVHKNGQSSSKIVCAKCGFSQGEDISIWANLRIYISESKHIAGCPGRFTVFRIDSSSKSGSSEWFQSSVRNLLLNDASNIEAMKINYSFIFNRFPGTIILSLSHGSISCWIFAKFVLCFHDFLIKINHFHKYPYLDFVFLSNFVCSFVSFEFESLILIQYSRWKIHIFLNNNKTSYLKKQIQSEVNEQSWSALKKQILHDDMSHMTSFIEYFRETKTDFKRHRNVRSCSSFISRTAKHLENFVNGQWQLIFCMTALVFIPFRSALRWINFGLSN